MTLQQLIKSPWPCPFHVSINGHYHDCEVCRNRTEEAYLAVCEAFNLSFSEGLPRPNPLVFSGGKWRREDHEVKE